MIFNSIETGPNGQFICSVLAIVFLLTVFTVSPLSAKEGREDLEIIAGPKMFNIERKGAMLRIFTIKDLKVDRAHQLKLSFFPKIENNSLIVKFFKIDGTPLGKPVALQSGRKALLDLDSGLDSLMVMIEELGSFTKRIRIFASMLRYEAGKGPETSGKGKAIDENSAGVPPQLISEIDLLEEAGGNKRTLRRTLKALNITEKQGKELALCLKNSYEYMKKGQFGAVNYYLKKAENIAICGEVYSQRAFAFAPVDIDVAIENINKGIALFKEGKSAAVLVGKGDTVPEARACVIAGNMIIQKAFAIILTSDEEEKVLKVLFDKFLSRALSVDKKGAKKPVQILEEQWVKQSEQKKKLVESRKQRMGSSESGDMGKLDESVKNFFEARRLFAMKKFPEVLAFIDKHPHLPKGDTAYLKAEVLLNMGRKQGAKKALNESVVFFEKGQCLAGLEGGIVEGTQGKMPPAAIRAALSRVSLARYWAEKFVESRDGSDKKVVSGYIQTAIDYMDKAIEAVPSHREWQLLVNTYRTSKLKYLYP